MRDLVVPVCVVFCLFPYLACVMLQPDFKAIKKRIEDLITRDYLERDKDNANMYKYLAWLVVVGESKQASRLAQYHGVAAPAVSWCLNNFCPDLQHLLDISVRAAYPPSHSTAGHILYIRRLNRIIVLTYTRCMVIWKQERHSGTINRAFYAIIMSLSPRHITEMMLASVLLYEMVLSSVLCHFIFPLLTLPCCFCFRCVI